MENRNYIATISEKIASGALITHILSYQLRNEPEDKNHALQIRQILKERSWNCFMIEQISTFPIPVTWTMDSAGPTCSYYYTDAGYIYSDTAICEHTKQMMKRLTNHIRVQHPEFGTSWTLSYLVTRAVGSAILQLN